VNIEGAVLRVSDTLTLVTDITAQALADALKGPDVTVHCDGHETPGIYTLDHDHPPGTFVALIGASGNLELTILGEDISMMLGIRAGEKVTVKW